MKILWRPSFRGVAYLASANFMARAIMFLGDFLQSFFSYEMVLLYGAHLDSQIVLFFQAVFMIPVFLLGCLVFVGIEKKSFNLVLYPTLMLLFVVLLRYGAELALLIIHWEVHKLDQAPGVIYYLVVDLICIAMLLLHVYFSLTTAPIRPTPEGTHLLEAPLLPNSNNKSKSQEDVEQDVEAQELIQSKKNKKKPPAPPPEGFEVPPPRPPPSPKFNYALRRNIGHLPKDSPERVLLEELNQQRQRNSQILPEEEAEEEIIVAPPKLRVKTQSLKVYDTEPKRRSLLFETDLDADEPVRNEPEEPKEVHEELIKEPEAKDVEEEGDSEVKVIEDLVEVKAPEGSVEEVKEEAEDESEYEYEYETEEEEEPEVEEVVVTLPRPKIVDTEVKSQEFQPTEVKSQDPKSTEVKGQAPKSTKVKASEETEAPTTSGTKSFKTTAV